MQYISIAQQSKQTMLNTLKILLLFLLLTSAFRHSVVLKLSQKLWKPNFMSSSSARSVDDHTRTSLDFDLLLNELQSTSITIPGKILLSTYIATDLSMVKKQYAMVEEITHHLEQLPIQRIFETSNILRKIHNNSIVPTKLDLVAVTHDIENIQDLNKYLKEHERTLTLFQELASFMELPEQINEAFHDAFDNDGKLNEDKYSIIKSLRSSIQRNKFRVIQALQGLVNSPSMRDKLADSGYIEMNGRYCLQLHNTHKRGVGIVHASSNSGHTVYVEPFQVIETTNQVKELEARLQEEENRIYRAMCHTLYAHLDAVYRCISAVAEVDVLAAKARLGVRLGGVIPQVGEEGVVHCREARHPILLLRATSSTRSKVAAKHSISTSTTASAGRQSPLQTSVVGNDLDLSSDASALVISGPNAGGKTIILKTVGLFALMVQYGIPLPARSGARVDLFRHVLADIGDAQSVSADVSTFSGHMQLCRDILSRVARSTGKTGSCNSALVLLDEVGTGTDPAQGSALAQAVLEELVACGARVIATTHYARVKVLAVSDARFRIAAMEFVHQHPTFRLRVGSVGESFAFETARRLQLPAPVLARATELLGNETQRLVELEEHLQEECEKTQLLQQQLQEQRKTLSQEIERVHTTQVQIDALIQEIRKGETEAFLIDIKRKESEINSWVQSARDMIASENKHHGKDLEEKLERIKEKVKTERVSVESAVVSNFAEKKGRATPLQPGQAVEVGTELMVLEPGSMLLGCTGIVIHRNRGRGRVALRVAGVEVKMDRHLLGVPVSRIAAIMQHSSSSDPHLTPLSGKDKRLKQLLLEEFQEH